MNLKILFSSLLILSLSPLVVQACPTGNPRSLAYIRRDNNRCEGLQDRNASGTFNLISFSTSNLSDYPNTDTLNIRVPGTGRTRPAVTVQSFDRNYRLDNLNTRSSSSGFTFALNTNVLKKAEVAVGSLRATAYITRNSAPVYFPVILGQASDRYVFVVYAPERTTFPTFEIRRNGKAVTRSPRTNPQQGQIRLAWEYGDAPAGSYELYIVDGQKQRRTFRFEHDPNWPGL